MTNKTFNHVLKVLLQLLEANLNKKGQEYSGDGDRFHNFKMAANELRKRKVKVNDSVLLGIEGMRLKHDISIDDIRRSIYHGETSPEFDAAYLIEKYGDEISYLILEFAYILSEYGVDLGPEWDESVAPVNQSEAF